MTFQEEKYLSKIKQYAIKEMKEADKKSVQSLTVLWSHLRHACKKLSEDSSKIPQKSKQYCPQTMFHNLEMKSFTLHSSNLYNHLSNVSGHEFKKHGAATIAHIYWYAISTTLLLLLKNYNNKIL